MKLSILLTLACTGCMSFALSAHASPEIAYVTSYYKTASGAIGPHNVIATHVYEIKINGTAEITIDRIIARRREFICEPVVLKRRDRAIDVTLSVTIHQKYGGGARYTTRLQLGDGKVHVCTGRDMPRNNTQDVGPAIVIYAHDDHAKYVLIRDVFDQERSQFNK